MPHHRGSHREALGLVRRQRERGKLVRALIGVSMRRNG